MHVVGYELNSTTRTRHGPDRTRTDPHGLFLRRNSVGSVRVRSGPIVEFSYYTARSLIIRSSASRLDWLRGCYSVACILIRMFIPEFANSSSVHVLWTGLSPNDPPLTPTRYRLGDGETIFPRRWQFDGGKNRGGSTSVRKRVRSPHISGGRRWLSCRQPACL